jgi:hypothetical protein
VVSVSVCPKASNMPVAVPTFDVNSQSFGVSPIEDAEARAGVDPRVEVDELVAEAQRDGHEDAHIPGPVSVFRVKAELVRHGYHPANGNSSRGSTRVK